MTGPPPGELLPATAFELSGDYGLSVLGREVPRREKNLPSGQVGGMSDASLSAAGEGADLLGKRILTHRLKCGCQ